ncbi:MAG: XRE family transcriptional regulator [Rhodocyclaceae bacterium]|nr:MAG: XRE family transcriptional regulator [Rhodocyclaceae bacterium]TND04614.1 MAG: XRE family transcriptional regulator [Rhodocyclaceae bacterium]
MQTPSIPQTNPSGDAAEALPENLRRMRQEARLTLDRLAALSGVSRAMISKIERGTSVPTATVLGKLAGALHISLSQLLGEFHARQPRLHRKENQAIYRDPASGFERRSLSPVFEDGAVDLALNVLPPGEAVEFPPHHAGVEEFLVVHEGTLTVLLDGKRFDVESGDTLFYPSDCIHEFRNEGEQPTVFYIVINDRTRR